MKIKAVLLILLLFLFGCANPSISHYDKMYFDSKKPGKIVVFRFEGNPNFVEEATDYYVSLVANGMQSKILSMGPVRTESSDIIAGGNLASSETAIIKAKEQSADLVILGKVTSHSTGGMLNGFATIHIYNVSTSERVATFHRPSGMLIGYSEHQAVMRAVRRTAGDTLQLLK